MSEQADRLADMARNRGLRLVRSRVRTPGKPGFGMFGLTDVGGAPVFGIGNASALEADAAAVEDYLRGSEAGDWKASLTASGGRPPVKAKTAKPAPPPPPEPKPAIREAKPSDADQLSALFSLLDHRIEPAAIRRNLKAMSAAGDCLLVCAIGRALVGACAAQSTVHPHRRGPVGRNTIIVVAEGHRGAGVGRALLEEAEQRLSRLGCGLVEVTSNDRLWQAHAFYQHLGYERTSLRFAKSLGSG